jgi:hypothetical protein
MRTLLAVFLFIPLSGPLTLAQNAIVRVFADQKNQVHVVYQNGQNAAVAGETEQVGIDSVKIAKDGQTAGWLVLYTDPDSSTPFAGTLVLWRNGRIAQSFEAEQTFWSWSFYANTTQVAYHVGPTHGEAPHCELHEIESGRLLASWDGDLDNAKRPAWTKGLEH